MVAFSLEKRELEKREDFLLLQFNGEKKSDANLLRLRATGIDRYREKRVNSLSA